MQQLLKLGLLGLLAGSCGPSNPNSDGTLSQMAGSAFEAETNVAANRSGNAVAAWMTITAGCFPSVGYAVSSDGGGSWSAPTRLDAPGGRRSEDPSVAVDSQGNHFLAWLGTAGGSDYHIYLSRSSGTEMFGAPVDLSGGDATAKVDFPRIVVDAGDNVGVSWLDRANDALMFARSTDHAATFQLSTIVSSPGLGSRAGLVQPCVDMTAPANTASIYATYLEWDAAKQLASVLLERSTDGGKSWSAASANPPVTDALRLPPTCAVRGNDVWIEYTKGTDAGSVLSPASSIWVRHSSDGGKSYDPERVVSNGPAADLYLIPKMAMADGGNLVVAYYEGQSMNTAALMRAESTDGGSSWTQTTWTSSGTFAAIFNPCTNPPQTQWLGDSIGLASSGATASSTFADNAAGPSHIRFVKN